VKNRYSRQAILFFGVLFVQLTHASTIFIKLGSKMEVNPETGMESVLVLNPSGVAELSYFNRGLKISYTNEQGLEESVKIHFDFSLNDFPSTEGQGQGPFVNLFKEAKANGHRIVGSFLKSLLPTSNEARLFLDRGRRPGYIMSDFEASQVNFVTSVGTFDLKSFVYQTVHAYAKEAQNKNTEEKERRIGFDLEAHYVSSRPVSQGSCLALLGAQQ
jgi:hypothetical protein